MGPYYDAQLIIYIDAIALTHSGNQYLVWRSVDSTLNASIITSLNHIINMRTSHSKINTYVSCTLSFNVVTFLLSVVELTLMESQ